MMEEFKEAVLLYQADYVLIYKGGFDVLKLRNVKYPKSGRSLYIQLNSARNELIRYIETARGRHYYWAETASMVGIFCFVECLATYVKFPDADPNFVIQLPFSWRSNVFLPLICLVFSAM
jgi:hypothetical protein